MSYKQDAYEIKERSGSLLFRGYPIELDNWSPSFDNETYRIRVRVAVHSFNTSEGVNHVTTQLKLNSTNVKFARQSLKNVDSSNSEFTHSWLIWTGQMNSSDVMYCMGYASITCKVLGVSKFYVERLESNNEF